MNLHMVGQPKINTSTVLDEANFLGVAAEALSAAHKPILPDQSMWVTTHTAAKQWNTHTHTHTHKKRTINKDHNKGNINLLINLTLPYISSSIT